MAEAAEGEPHRSFQLFVPIHRLRQNRSHTTTLPAGYVERRGIVHLFAPISPFYIQLHLRTTIPILMRRILSPLLLFHSLSYHRLVSLSHPLTVSLITLSCSLRPVWPMQAARAADHPEEGAAVQPSDIGRSSADPSQQCGEDGGSEAAEGRPPSVPPKYVLVFRMTQRAAPPCHRTQHATLTSAAFRGTISLIRTTSYLSILYLIMFSCPSTLLFTHNRDHFHATLLFLYFSSSCPPPPISSIRRGVTSCSLTE